MVEGSLRWATEAMGGRLVGADAAFHGVSTDTRTLASHQLFFALQGERVDAHEHVPQALATGAAAAVVAHEVPVAGAQIVVPDTRLALGRLARAWRRTFDLPVIAITGSNGKTTTKEMVASILRRVGPTLATQGNLNNDIGVPLTLFQLAHQHRHAVIEMGANRPSDIRDLVEIAEPTLGLVTLVSAAHLAGFGTLGGVARAKGEIYARLGGQGWALINQDDPFQAQWTTTAGAARVLRFALDASADVTAREVVAGPLGQGSTFRLLTPAGGLQVHLPLDGLHNVRNALAAAAVGHALGLSLEAIRDGLEAVGPVKGRLNVKTAPSGMVLIDDTYNANPSSLAAGLALLGGQPGKRWLLLGDMGELGDEAPRLHFEAGLAARQAGVEKLFAVGPLAAEAARAFGDGAYTCTQRDEAVAEVRARAGAGVTLLVKASRFMQFELATAALMEDEVVATC